MSQPSSPRHGSLQFWPRKRAKTTIARVRSWVLDNKAKPLGFIGYKAGMTHVMVTDNRPKSLTKGESVAVPVTIVECPSLTVMGLCFYKKTASGLQKVGTQLSSKLDKELSRALSLPKKTANHASTIAESDDIRLLVHTNPKMVSIGSKKPQLLELALGGSKEEKIKYAPEVLGKELQVTDIFQPGNQIDVHGITKGKGLQGTVKRFGVPLRQHKAEKTKRGIATLGPWTPKRVDFTVPHAGKMGYHLRTEYNKQILKIGNEGSDVTPTGGITKYGIVKNRYVLIKGSVMGPRKRAFLLTHPRRPNMKLPKEAPEITHISHRN